jgi:transcriptional regulator with XRE-family HTH domain
MAKKRPEASLLTAAPENAKQSHGPGPPPLPPPDAKGNYPALEAVTALLARDIIAHRERLGLSQAELARLAGIRPETLNRLEQGKHAPSAKTVDKIEKALQRLESERSDAEPWQQVSVLARKDPEGPYSPENCFWRPARNAKEARMGIEEWFTAEPDELPLTASQKRQREKLRTEDERRLFDIWARMLWRASHQPEAN